ncbi:metallopeptidase family protein [Rhodococcus sp. D2-41]|uniref:Metallopeptidase family protein n=1 Tax=Speluncibacter jeojiensis TaxID=2710754 RepID=A0A9X4LYT4_9ACTN|nr:metallopeptidase family protein [Rhodococcus sp. D2-41]MDG3008804.1 metallopeptidase family protein [Rhodococcus sp. D2-41]MDG3012987.1 metallopeptidase family protein [Corynebacteriales bacterium D3-21]
MVRQHDESSRRRLSSRGSQRRGRGIRGSLLPLGVPGRRTRSERFDGLVIEAFSEIDRRWHDQLTKLDIAVDDVPRIRALDPDSVTWPPEVVAEGPVPLSRLVPAGMDRNGDPTRARVVLFRRPLELRAKHPDELTLLVHDVLVEQVATYLGLDPETIDPSLRDD